MSLERMDFLVVAVYALTPPIALVGAEMEGGGWGRRIWAMARPLVLWGAVAAVTYAALWPAMWVKPLDVVRQVIHWAFFHVETIHENPIFFNGQIGYGDPGLLFYVATIAWKMTIVTLPMAVAALIYALPGVRRSGWYRSRMVWLLALYAICFTLQMGLGDWKQVSYMVPVFPALDVLAAFGLVRTAEMVGRARLFRRWRWLPATFIVVAFALQAVRVLPRHPYYGTHHNALLGGSRTAQHVLLLQDQGEGLDLAAQFLNLLPRADQARARVHQ